MHVGRGWARGETHFYEIQVKVIRESLLKSRIASSNPEAQTTLLWHFYVKFERDFANRESYIILIATVILRNLPLVWRLIIFMKVTKLRGEVFC